MLNYEHPADILAFCANKLRMNTEVCIAILTATQGGGVRGAGAMMAITVDDAVGYLSNGCVDADIIAQARDALRGGDVRDIQYGEDSPFTDLKLPCGGAITVTLLPRLDLAQIHDGYDTLLKQRNIWRFNIAAADKAFFYRPKIRLRICGGNTDARAIATLARTGGFDTEIWTKNPEQFPSLGPVKNLDLPSRLPPLNDDRWTAVICLFHDLEWEIPVLSQALDGPAFYLGAVGSRTTHANRVAALQALGVDEGNIDRISGPVGLVPSTRDASRLAISALAEIIDIERKLPPPEFSGLGLILLGAGASKRFGSKDKLLASFRNKPLISYATATFSGYQLHTRLAVTRGQCPDVSQILLDHGWTELNNPRAEDGKATTLKRGLEVGLQTSHLTHFLILLGDMPQINDAHLRQLIAHRGEADIIYTSANNIKMPPMVISRGIAQHTVDHLPDGDAGLMAYLPTSARLKGVEIAPSMAVDIDTPQDLEALNHD